MAATLRVSVDKMLCVSNGWCMRSVPGVFKPDADGQSEVVDVDGAPEEAIVDAALNCPVGAISIVDAETGLEILL